MRYQELYKDFRFCNNCKCSYESYKFKEFAKINSENDNVMFFAECPACGAIEEIDADSIPKYVKERLIIESKNNKYEIIFIICFYTILFLLLYFCPKVLFCIILFFFTLYLFSAL